MQHSLRLQNRTAAEEAPESPGIMQRSVGGSMREVPHFWKEELIRLGQPAQAGKNPKTLLSLVSASD